MSTEGALVVVLASSPFALRPFGKPSAPKLANLCQIVLSGGQMAETDDFEIPAVCGVVMFTARQLPLAIGMMNDQCHWPLRSKDVPAYNCSGFRH